jgi:hypothetical protein
MSFLAPTEQPSYDAPPGVQEGRSATESVPQVIYAPPTPPVATNGHKEPCAKCGALIGASQQARAAHARFCVAQRETSA